jgi:hypothetical protein
MKAVRMAALTGNEKPVDGPFVEYQQNFLA